MHRDVKLKVKTRKLGFTYGFVGEGHPWCAWGRDGGVGKVRSFARVAGVGS